MTELNAENFGKILKEKLDEGFEAQARLINTAFQGEKEHLDERFDNVDQRLDKVEERLGVVETKLDRALYTELVHLETRIKRIEEKVGIKPQIQTA